MTDQTPTTELSEILERAAYFMFGAIAAVVLMVLGSGS